MAEITLVRHGQASFGADNYDQLSELGKQQAHWLGQYLKTLGQQYDRVVIGSMARHEQTAQAIAKGLGAPLSFNVHAGLNEYDFAGLLQPLQQQFPEQWHSTGHARRDYYHNMKLALAYWMEGSIADDGHDSWHSFCQRINAGFQYACGLHQETQYKRILVVSSGGPIAVILAQVLQLDQKRTRDVTLQIKNSSMSKLLFRRHTDEFSLDSFNDVSHLQTADKQRHITFS